MRENLETRHTFLHMSKIERDCHTNKIFHCWFIHQLHNSQWWARKSQQNQNTVEVSPCEWYGLKYCFPASYTGNRLSS